MIGCSKNYKENYPRAGKKLKSFYPVGKKISVSLAPIKISLAAREHNALSSTVLRYCP